MWIAGRAVFFGKTFYDCSPTGKTLFFAEFDDVVARIGVVAGAAYEREGSWREKFGAPWRAYSS